MIAPPDNASRNLILVRHGNTEANTRGALIGARSDPSLSPEGQGQVEALCDRLLESPNHAQTSSGRNRLICSPQRRAQQTANIIARRLEINLVTDPRWAELDYGLWDGKTPEEIGHAPTERFWADPNQHPPPQGESPSQVAARVQDGLTALLAMPSSRHIVVSHKSTLRVALCLLFGVDPNDYRRSWQFEEGAHCCVEFTSDTWRMVAAHGVARLDPKG